MRYAAIAAEAGGPHCSGFDRNRSAGKPTARGYRGWQANATPWEDMMTQRLSIVAVALFALAGCESSSSPSTVAQPLASAAPAAPAATGEPISPGNRPAFCRGEASAQYGVRPAFIQTSAPATAADGSISIDGTANQGADGKKAFRCRFNSSGRFIDVMAMTSGGAL